jgi:hypothetical protein
MREGREITLDELGVGCRVGARGTGDGVGG